MIRKAFYVLGAILVLASCQPKEIQVIEQIYEDGSPKIVFDYLLKRGDSIALHEVQYHNDGSILLEGDYQNGLREGEWISWYPDGTVWSKGYFRKGKRSGKSWAYHPNGKLYMKGSYEEGKKIGPWLVYDEEGNVIANKEF